LELSYLELLTTEQRHVLIKRMENTVIAEIDLSGLDEFVEVLTGEKAVKQSWAA
jgi:type IV secretory pathway VirB4 component